MNPKLPHSSKAGFFVCAVLLVSVTGCVESGDRSRGGYVQAGYSNRVDPVFGDQDDYVYYPGYQMYYGQRSHRYYYQEGSSWVGRPNPQHVSVNVLNTAPRVNIDFHDSPAKHHTEIVKKYPKQWQAPPANHGRNDDHKDDHHDDNDHNRR